MKIATVCIIIKPSFDPLKEPTADDRTFFVWDITSNKDDAIKSVRKCVIDHFGIYEHIKLGKTYSEFTALPFDKQREFIKNYPDIARYRESEVGNFIDFSFKNGLYIGIYASAGYGIGLGG